MRRGFYGSWKPARVSLHARSHDVPAKTDTALCSIARDTFYQHRVSPDGRLSTLARSNDYKRKKRMDEYPSLWCDASLELWQSVAPPVVDNYITRCGFSIVSMVDFDHFR
jgi:hypothetical protein